MALFEIDESSGLPVWVQLRNRFVYLIKTGHYQPGDQLPSVRTLAAEAAINYNTVSKVYVNLESDGYVESVRGRGVFVRDIGGKADDVRSIADTEIKGCIRRCLALGMTSSMVIPRARQRRMQPSISVSAMERTSSAFPPMSRSNTPRPRTDST